MVWFSESTIFWAFNSMHNCKLGLMISRRILWLALGRVKETGKQTFLNWRQLFPDAFSKLTLNGTISSVPPNCTTTAAAAALVVIYSLSIFRFKTCATLELLTGLPVACWELQQLSYDDEFADLPFLFCGWQSAGLYYIYSRNSAQCRECEFA